MTTPVKKGVIVPLRGKRLIILLDRELPIPAETSNPERITVTDFTG